MVEEKKNDKNQNPQFRPLTKFEKVCHIIILFCVIGLILIFGFTLCSGSSSDEPWGHIQHTINTDPYFDQWD